MKPRRLRLIAFVSIVLSAVGFGAYLHFFRYNPAASCSNCRRQASAVLDEYALRHDGWYPRGAGNPMGSLALAIADAARPEHEVGFFTSHALTTRAQAYYARHKAFHEDYSCYRYNEGLRGDDSGSLIILYYFEPTRWECENPRHRADEVGRNILAGGSWEFVPEAEFQRRQAATLAFLESRAKRGPE